MQLCVSCPFFFVLDWARKYRLRLFFKKTTIRGKRHLRLCNAHQLHGVRAVGVRGLWFQKMLEEQRILLLKLLHQVEGELVSPMEYGAMAMRLLAVGQVAKHCERLQDHINHSISGGICVYRRILVFRKCIGKRYFVSIFQIIRNCILIIIMGI